MDLAKSMIISAAGMRAQSQRMRVIAENLANANSLSLEPGGEPYRRKVISFANQLDRTHDVNLVAVTGVVPDRSPFQRKYDPAHPAADADGYLFTPNVNSLIEVMDMKEAQRSYEANLSVIENVKAMLSQTVKLLSG